MPTLCLLLGRSHQFLEPGSGLHHRASRLYERGDRSKVPADHAEKLENILFALDNAFVVEALDLPGFRLHPLKGDLKGFWSISVRANWRVIVRFQDGQAHDVDLVDYLAQARKKDDKINVQRFVPA